MENPNMTENEKNLLRALDKAHMILNRDGIRPLLGLAFSQNELEFIEKTLKDNGIDPLSNK